MLPYPLTARRLWLAAAFVLIVVVLGFGLRIWAHSWRPALGEFPIQGIDVSEANGTIDWWAARRGGVQFAYSVATSGAHHRDPSFADNWHRSAEAGLERGAIHIFSLCEPAIDQAGNFVSTVARTDKQLSPALFLDFQPDCAARPSRSAVVDEVRRFVQAVETHTGNRAILKVSSAFESEYQLSSAISQPLWSSQAFFKPWYLARPWTMWQASSFHRIEGVETPVNWDVMAR